MIVVHSAAIRAGVLKTFDQTADHFADTFPDLAYGWGAMTDNSGLDDFIDPSDAVRFLVVMIQSFDKPDTNVVYRGPEAMSLWGESQTRMATLSGTQPVLVIDEPQNMETDKRRRAPRRSTRCLRCATRRRTASPTTSCTASTRAPRTRRDSSSRSPSRASLPDETPARRSSD